MRLTSALSALSLLASVALGDTAINPPACPTIPTAPIGFTKILTAKLAVSDILAPIPVPGGIRVVELYTGGPVTGSAFNGTVVGGVGTPVVYDNGAWYLTSLVLYGSTNDDVSFILNLDGNGTPAVSFARIQLDIGGKYSSLSQEFLFSTAVVAADNKSVLAEVYITSLNA